MYRGYSKYKLKDFQGAISDINQSIKKDATNSYAYKNLALVCIALDSLEPVCGHLEKAASLGYKDKYGDDVEDLINEWCEN